MKPCEAMAILRNEQSIDDPHIDSIGLGLRILLKYYDGKPMEYVFGDGQMWVSGFEKSVEAMLEETVKRLSLLGWFVDQNCWSHFDSFVDVETGERI